MSSEEYKANQLGYNSPKLTSQNMGNSTFFEAIFPKNEGTPIFQNVAIVSKKAKKVLDVCQDAQRKGMLIIYEDYNQPNQRFDIVKYGSYVKIINKQNGKILTVVGNSEKNGAPIIEEPSSEMVGQKFRLAEVQKGQYVIHTFCGKALDCCEEKTSNGTAIIQWKCDRKQHQLWLIK